MSIAHLRQEYARASLSEHDVHADPIQQFGAWFEQARNAELMEPNAMALATASSDGQPSVRMVLLKEYSERGFVFYTDYRSRKGDELGANAKAGLCFWWDALQRQVRITGTVERLTREEAAEYYRVRPYGSRVGAWASHQSQALADRATLEREVARVAAEHPEGSDVPLPPHWGGFRVVPIELEFWQGRPSRLHDRVHYVRQNGAWTLRRLSP
jgi:pyridoxamine 5'-phosphate oxidase